MILPIVLILFSALPPHVYSNTICQSGEIALGYSQNIPNDQTGSQFPSASSQITIFSADCAILSSSADVGQIDYCGLENAYSGGYGVVCDNNRNLAWITAGDMKFASCYKLDLNTSPPPNCDSQTDSNYLETSVLYCCGAIEGDNTAPQRTDDGVYHLRVNEDILPQSPNRLR